MKRRPRATDESHGCNVRAERSAEAKFIDGSPDLPRNRLDPQRFRAFLTSAIGSFPLQECAMLFFGNRCRFHASKPFRTASAYEAIRRDVVCRGCSRHSDQTASSLPFGSQK
jgi:hypothetical protein